MEQEWDSGIVTGTAAPRATLHSLETPYPYFILHSLLHLPKTAHLMFSPLCTLAQIMLLAC